MGIASIIENAINTDKEKRYKKASCLLADLNAWEKSLKTI